jgi:hypothetical protein
MAPSHEEIGVADADSVFVLERYVTQVGQAKGFIVARCDMSDHQRAVIPLDLGKPCSGYNVIDTHTGRVWRGLDDIAAEWVLKQANVAMPAMATVSDYFNQAWPEDRSGNFCLVHPQESASARRGFTVQWLIAIMVCVLFSFLFLRIALKRRWRS